MVLQGAVESGERGWECGLCGAGVGGEGRQGAGEGVEVDGQDRGCCGERAGEGEEGKRGGRGRRTGVAERQAEYVMGLRERVERASRGVIVEVRTVGETSLCSVDSPFSALTSTRMEAPQIYSSQRCH